MNPLKLLVRKLIFGSKATSESYIDYLRSKGAQIGSGVKIYSPNQTFIDEQFPFLLSIGNNVNITLGVHILTHDYSWSVIKAKSGKVMGGVNSVVIGDNVFLGVGSVVLMGTQIGNNVIVGAGSVVHGSIPDNSVVAGNPAKVICSLKAYAEKRASRQYEEATNIVKRYRKVFDKNPPKEKLPAYFYLFEQRTGMNNPIFQSRLRLTGNYELSKREFESSEPMFENYDEFLKSIY